MQWETNWMGRNKKITMKKSSGRENNLQRKKEEIKEREKKKKVLRYNKGREPWVQAKAKQKRAKQN